MSRDANVNQVQKVSSFSFNIISIANVISSVNIALVENFHHIAAEESWISRQRRQKSLSGSVANVVGAFVHELKFVGSKVGRFSVLEHIVKFLPSVDELLFLSAYVV